MSGLAGLKVKPIRVLVLVVAVVRSVMDSGWLVVRVPGVDLLAAGRYLWLCPGPITTRQIDGGAGAEARYQITAVARVVLRWNDRAGDIESLPAESMEDGCSTGVMP
jgi:hypothetical protein